MQYLRSKDILALAAGEHCTLRIPGVCIDYPCVSAHSNSAKHGKGKSIKAHDCFVAWSCDACHREIDQGKNLSREEKIIIWERGFILTLPRLMSKLLSNDRPRASGKVDGVLPKIVPHPGRF